MAARVLGPEVRNASRQTTRSFIMSITTSNYIVLAAIIAVAAVLFFGLFNMMRGGSANLSQKLMRWRVGLQFVAIVIIMGVLWLRS